jgi:uncharacterized protein
MINACTLIKSKSENTYFYDRKIESTQWCHPLLYYILTLHNRGIDPQQWYNELGEDPVQLEGCPATSKEEIAYYLQKYLLLKDNGYFSRIDTGHYLSERLNAAQMETSLANTRQVTFEVVDYCNLDCDYCTYGKFYDNYDHRENNKLSTRKAKTFLDYLLKLLNSPLNHSHGRRLYISFYGGEPLLNFPFIREIVDYVLQLKPVHNRFCFNMTTNGLLLDKYMDFLVEHNFELLISLDGNERNNSYRVFKDGTPAFGKIVDNINALKSKYPEYFESKVDFNAVFHNRNSVSDIHRYFKRQFDKIPSISELNSSGVSSSMKKEFWKTYANIDASLANLEDYAVVEKDMFLRLPNIQGVSKFIDRCSGCVFDDYNELLVSAKNSYEDPQPRLPTGTCIPFSKKVFITVNGKILPCEQVGHRFSLGQVHDDKVDLDFERIAETYNRYYDALKKQCTACANSKDCLQCLFFLDFENQTFKCSGLLNTKEHSQFLSSRISYLEQKPQHYMKIMKEVIIE